VTISNGYTDQATFKSYMGLTVTTYDTFIDQTITAASRAIDNYCQRRFWLDTNPVARTFEPQGLLTLDLNDDRDNPLGAEIGDTTGLTIATDPGGTGTFSVTWAATDYQLLPQNAAYAFPEPRPWTSVRAVGTKTFPWLVNTWLTHLNRVQITAKWGWPAIPATVTQACLIKSARLFHRKDSPQGVAGFGEFGVVRISQKDDPDVCSMLDPYRRQPVLVA